MSELGEPTNSLTHELNNSLTHELNKLMEYFFIGLTLPNEAFWVNLRPDSPDNIIDSDLAQTDIGKILLEADVQLKKDTALYTSPQIAEGKKYWDKLYKKAEELYGYDNITIPTLTRPWIVPGEIIIRETPDNAYIYKATLKVMLEEDYLSSRVREFVSSREPANSRTRELNIYSTQLIKELIIPKLIKDINTTKRYAALRQVYYSLILAQWFKKQSSVVSDKSSVKNNLQLTTYDLRQRINSSNLTGLTSQTPWSKNTYYQQYQKSFTDGEYNLKEPMHTPYGQIIRSYFSGGIGLGQQISEVVSSGIIQGRPDINPEQIFSQTAESSGINNNISAVFKDGNLTVEVPDVVAKEADISDNPIVSNKRSFLIKKTLPFFLTAIIALNSFLFFCAQIKPRQQASIYQTQEHAANTVYEKNLIRIINSMEINNAETSNILTVLVNTKLPVAAIDALVLKLQDVYDDGIQGENEEMLLDVILWQYNRQSANNIKTQTIINNALKKITYEVLFNLRDVFQLSQDEVNTIKRKVDKKLKFSNFNRHRSAANANFKIYQYSRQGYSRLDSLKDILAHEIGHNILMNKGVSPGFRLKTEQMHELFSYLSGTAQVGYFLNRSLLGTGEPESHAVAVYQIGMIDIYFKGDSVLLTDLQKIKLRLFWETIAKVALDEICKGKTFKEVVQAMFREAGYKGDLKAVRIKGLKRDIYIPVDFKIKPGEDSNTGKIVSSSIDKTEGIIEPFVSRIQ